MIAESDLQGVVIELSDGPADALLVCLHASSGSSIQYRNVARLCQATCSAIGLDSPDFDDQPSSIPDFRSLCRSYAEMLAPRVAGVRLVLLGWSVGGSFAHLVAVFLQQLGVNVEALILIDSSVPRVIEQPSARDLAVRFCKEASFLADDLDQNTCNALEEISNDASSDDVLRVVASAFPDEVDVSLLAERFNVFEAIARSSFDYAVTDVYPGTLIHFVATGSRLPERGWSGFCGELVERRFDADHFSILEVAASEIAEQVDSSLQRTW